MTPNEKASALIKKFRYPARISGGSGDSIPAAKECADILCGEIIKILETLHKPEYTSFIAKKLFTIEETEYETHIHGYELINYWQQVKKEIKKL